MRYALIVTLLLALTSTQAWAQLESSSPAQQRAANRKALRDARRFDAKYKESHLTVDKEELKDQAAGRLAVHPPTAERASYRFDRTGAPRVSEPSRLNFRLRKKRDAAVAP
ncbi:hypothetical protein KLP40_19940 [Hymenobacter sp. NST-14]|uniref:hypothetical protein n=1 Tax=Hymenobacter piscis TaxID=2839984 RepID=UPI001C00A385|nr:hypothetical protein [Hymenobacter piscis]MBT9395446.1 hypothetical protein [Hymenobacter piscis]